MLIMKPLNVKASSTRFKAKFKMSNVIWQDPKEALTSLKSWWTLQWLFSSFVSLYMLKKKAAFSLSSIRLVDQRGTRLKICKLQQLYFEVYIKLEMEEERVRLIEYFQRCKSFHPSTFWTIRKLLIVISVWKIFFLFCNR